MLDLHCCHFFRCLEVSTRQSFENIGTRGNGSECRQASRRVHSSGYPWPRLAKGGITNNKWAIATAGTWAGLCFLAFDSWFPFSDSWSSFSLLLLLLLNPWPSPSYHLPHRPPAPAFTQSFTTCPKPPNTFHWS